MEALRGSMIQMMFIILEIGILMQIIHNNTP